MSFTYDPQTALGRVRLNLADTHQDTAVFADEEVQVALDECVGDVACATVALLRVLKAAAALRGEYQRVAAIDEVIAAYPSVSAIPIVETIYPAPWPMDDGYREPT